MSKVVKGVKKAFKKVTKVAKKIAPVALAVGALVFTGGAALGLAPMAGGWSAAASTVASSLGASGAVGAALTGAITQAGYGALIGGVLGGKEGMKRGAAAGLLTGAATGTINAIRQGTQAAGAVTKPLTGPTGQNIQVQQTFPAAAADPLSVPLPPSAQRIPVAGAAAPTGGGLMTQTPQAQTWWERNRDMIGSTVQGLGESVASNANAEAYSEANLRYLREREALQSGHYEGADPGQQYRGLARGPGPAPSERYDSVYSDFEYQYDPKQGRVVRVPI